MLGLVVICSSIAFTFPSSVFTCSLSICIVLVFWSSTFLFGFLMGLPFAGIFGLSPVASFPLDAAPSAIKPLAADFDAPSVE